MYQLGFTNPITANGEYNITGLEKGEIYAIKAADTWGGGSIVCSDDTGPGGRFVPMKNSTLNDAGDFFQFQAMSSNLRLTLSGATNPELQITLTRKF